MGKHSVFPTVLGGIVAACVSLGAMTALAQTPPATIAPEAPAAPDTAAPNTSPTPVATPPKAGKPTGKPAVAGQPNRKYERSYSHYKVRAVRRGLKGTERRVFIRRCELGFAPPRSQISPGAQPVIEPVPGQPGAVPAVPAPVPMPGASPASK